MRTPRNLWFGLNDSGETGLLVDRDCGFSVAFPGHPHRTPILNHDDVPSHDARVMIKDIPVEIRMRVDKRPEGIQATPLAIALAQTFAGNRTRSEIKVSPAQEKQRKLWTVEGAASTMYPLKTFDPSGADSEEVLVLVRENHVVTLTKSFAGAFTDSTRWTLFNSACAGSIRWNPRKVAKQVPHLWPRSTFLDPGIQGTLPEIRRAEARALTTRLPRSPELLKEAFPRLDTLIHGSEPPWDPFDEDLRTFVGRYLSEVFDRTAIRAYVEQEMARLQCAHDMRGLALILRKALEDVSSD